MQLFNILNFAMGGHVLFTLVATMCILNITLAANTNAPKVKDILADKDVQEALCTVWKESFLQNPKSKKVRGGWIYADSNYPNDYKYLLVQHTSKDHSPQGGDIELNNPEKDVVLSSDHYKLVASFHTHPFAGKTQQRAYSDDIKRTYERGVPGIVVSCSSVFYFGPECRASMDGPTGYLQSSHESYKGQKDVRFGNNKNVVAGQCSP